MKTLCAMLALTAGVTLLAGCEADPSAPSRPRTANPLAPDTKAQDNAFQRENEAPKRELPTSGKEFPGQTRATPATPAVHPPLTPPPAGATVITAGLFGGHQDPSLAAKPIPVNGTDSCIPETRYPPTNWYPGPLPNLPENPGTTPMVGSTPVPGTDWSIDHSWGEGLLLQNFPHRPWPEAHGDYVAGEVKHNPVYHFNIQQRLKVSQNDSTLAGNWMSNVYEVPWFCLETLALPAMLVVECPLKQVTTQRLGGNPDYLGYLPADGPIAPVPTPGVISWDYPFLRVPANETTTAPAETPIAPTPGLAPIVPGSSLGAPAPAQPREAEKYPGLR